MRALALFWLVAGVHDVWPTNGFTASRRNSEGIVPIAMVGEAVGLELAGYVFPQPAD